MQFLADGVVASGSYLTIALALALIFQVSKRLDFTVAGLIVLAPFAASSCVHAFGFGGACLSAVLLGAGIAGMIEAWLFLAVEHRRAGETTGLLLSYGVFIVVQNVLLLLFGPERRAITAHIVREGHLLLGARLTTVQLLLIILAIVASSYYGYGLARTREGRRIRAMGEDQELSLIVGVPSRAVRLRAVGLAGALISLVGLLKGLDTGITPYAGLEPVLLSVAVVLVGGSDVFRLITSALCVGLGQNLLVMWLGSEWIQTCGFVLVVAMLLVTRRGLFMYKPAQR